MSFSTKLGRPSHNSIARSGAVTVPGFKCQLQEPLNPPLPRTSVPEMTPVVPEARRDCSAAIAASPSAFTLNCSPLTSTVNIAVASGCVAESQPDNNPSPTNRAENLLLIPPIPPLCEVTPKAG